MHKSIFVAFLLGLLFVFSCSDVSQTNKHTFVNVNPTQIRQIVDLLKKSGSEPVILRAEDKDKIVVVSPKLVGRVMCAGMDGLEGQTNAFINAKQIEDGFSTSGYGARSGPGEGWNNFGGAERIWFTPEGGAYGFFFDPGAEQNWHNYYLSSPLHSVQYQITEKSTDGKSVTFAAPINLLNYAGYKIFLNVTREISVLEYCPFTIGFDDKTEFVGVESRTYVENTDSKALDKFNSPVGAWTVGVFNPGPQVIVLLPYRQGPISELGEPVTTEYFKCQLTVPRNDPQLAGHWLVEDGCVLVKADGKVQLKLEMLKRRSLGKLASVDLAKNEMTIVDFEFYPELDYAASFFLPYEGDLRDGGVLSTFMNVGEPLSTERPAIYELESCSPIMELQPQEQFCHISRTYHLRGDRKSIMEICRRFFNIDEKTLIDFDVSSR